MVKKISINSTILISIFLFTTSFAKKQPSLVPGTPSNAPDYFCTWSLQGYVVNFSGSENTRNAINERNIFGIGKYENWISFFPEIRSDLYFVMDDSWDIPQNVNSGNNKYLGLTELDMTRFPSFKGKPEERLKGLTDKIKSAGWKGAGGWICAQESAQDKNHEAVNEYWTEKLKAADYADFSYWKVDWGRHARNDQWRENLSNLGHKYAPNLFIEHAMKYEYIEFSDIFRTYDVEGIMSASVTIQRIAEVLKYKAKDGAKGIINCEDEPYIAAGLGCAIGIMRYPFSSTLPNDEQDFVFPPVGRDLKKRMTEITRAVRWHRIAEPFGVNADAIVDSVRLTDYWIIGERETWMNRPKGEKLTTDVPARISRNMPLPQISNLHSDDQPFVMASKYPNGAVSVVTIDRALGRECVLKQEVVNIEVTNLTSPIGIFGDYKELIMNYPQKIELRKIKIYGQDLASDTPIDITKLVKIDGTKIIVPGSLIRKVGLATNSEGDKSAPGMVFQIFVK